MRRHALGLTFVLSVACATSAEDTDKEDTGGTNNIDDSGDGVVGDVDADGVLVEEGDCDDNDATVFPGAPEVCDGRDNNCDGVVDEEVSTFYYIDQDGDGFGDEATGQGYCEPPGAGYILVGGDCDDGDADFNPSADEPCTENVDYNCDGEIAYADDDADGWAACEDCDDLDALVNPDIVEICNGVDDDCDGEADPTSSFDVLPFYRDADADGYGDVDSVSAACAAPEGYVEDTTDCDDARGDVNPGAPELCDAADTDEDCDGAADDADASVDTSTFTSWYTDADFDTYGDDASLVSQCDGPASAVTVGGDCRDTNANFYPGAPETDCADPNDYNCDGSVAYTDGDADGWAACEECDDADAAVNPAQAELCNGIDDDCDGITDPDTATDSVAWYADADTDTYGDAASTWTACAAPSGYVADATDCDDTDAAVYPGADELCNGVDDDCDAVVDPPTSLDASTWYADSDGDTFGDAASTTPACSQPAAYVADLTDCDDTDAAVFPGAVEVCNGIDDDCDTVIDPDTSADALTWYADADADTYGDAATTWAACAAPAGYVADLTDCDDARADVNPGAPELCDAADTDEDCDGLSDDDDPSTDPSSQTAWYTDADTDGYGDPAVTVSQCETPSGYVTDFTDCDDTRSGVHPGATEYCDALDDDEDCDGLSDDDDPSVSSTSYDTWYEDGDADGYGSTVTLDACDLPSGYSGTTGDCNDADDTINPAETEVCDSVDNDCDGTVDLSGGTDLCFAGPLEFEDCGATGYTGPTQTQCDSTYSGTDLDGEVTVSSGIQEWTVPTTGTYIIEAWGGQGYAGDPSWVGGKGAYATGEFSLTAGDVLYIVVGQRGTGGANSGGGGGGSFVVDSSGAALVVAGGGGGTRHYVAQNGCDGRSGKYGGTGSGWSTTSPCSTKSSSLGLGGIVSSTSWGSGGAGFNGDGVGEITTVPSWGGQGGKSWSSGMLGGQGNTYCGRADGGFGGGGSGTGGWGGGGGGGYSGGDGGRVAGGGGSYVDTSGSSRTTTAGVQSGDGSVIIDM